MLNKSYQLDYLRRIHSDIHSNHITLSNVYNDFDVTFMCRFEFMMVCPRQKAALWLDPDTSTSVSWSCFRIQKGSLPPPVGGVFAEEVILKPKKREDRDKWHLDDPKSADIL